MAKDTQRFSELEYALQSYFDIKVSKVMTAVKDNLNKNRADELRDYQRSTAGILSTMANSDKSTDTAMTVLRTTGEWNSKTVEDYVAECQKKLQSDKGFQKDLLTMAAEWRNAAVGQIGRERYDQMSQKLGGDLAYAYVATRMDDMMIEKLVKDGMPKSTGEYIMRKAAQSSIWGLEQELAKSPLAQEIEARGEAAFNPSKGAKLAGKVTGAVADVATMGISSWTSFAAWIGIDLAVTGLASSEYTPKQKEQAMETALSKAVFGSDSNLFTDFRKQSKSLSGKDNQYLSSLNSKLSNKIAVPTKPLIDYNMFDYNKNSWQPPVSVTPTGKEHAEHSEDVPLFVAPGQEEGYLADKAEDDRKAQAQIVAEKAKEEKPSYTAQSTSASGETAHTAASQTEPAKQQSAGSAVGNTSGWDQLLQATGLEGISDVGKNLGYVISMLPDVLVGMFTGKTQSLNKKNTMMPLAAIMLGMFVKNPLLKLALIGFGGLNLVNKAGKESLSWQEQNIRSTQQKQFRQYADEPLNPRITSPVLQGTTLIANIDRVPCNIQLTQNVVAAYEAGALPLNTLANAVLAKYDANRMAAQQQYAQAEQQTLSQTETIHRTR